MESLDYGVIGNCRSAALISKKGSIDWCCLPNFNSSSVFAALLDTEKGGSFNIEVDEDYTVSQKYQENTNILLTRFRKKEHIFELIDFMPRYKLDTGFYHTPPDIIRYIRHISGKPEVRFIYDPKLNYAQYETKNVIEDGYIKSFTVSGPYESIYLY